MKKWSIPLSIKIFTIIVVLVSLTAGVISWRNNAFIFSMLTRNFQTQSLAVGEKLGNEIEKFAIRMDNELYRILQKTLIQKGRNLVPVYKSFMESHPELDGFTILRNRSQKLEVVGARFRMTKLPKVVSEYSWLLEAIQADDSRKSHFAVREDAGRKYVFLARRFKVQKSNTSFWGVTVFSPKILEALFGESSNTEIALVNSDLDLLASNFDQESDWSEFKSKETLVKSVNLGVQSAYLGELADSRNNLWLSSFFKVQDYGLVIFVKSSKDIVYGRIYDMIEETVLWSILLLLMVIMVSYLSSRTVTKQLLSVIAATKEISKGQFNHKIKRGSGDEVGQLVDSVNLMAEKIAQLLDSEKEKVRFQEELQTAQIVQNAFYVNKDYEDENLLISGYHKASSECCGDWWGHVKLNDHIEQIFIGDATGHGAPAALVTGMVYSVVHNILESSKANGHISSPKEVLRQINQVMCKSLNGSMFMTFLALEINYQEGTLRYANAGHCFPFLMPIRPDEDERLDAASRRRGLKPILQPGKANTVLGAKEGYDFDEFTIPLHYGDRIFCYTDGAFEFNTEAGPQFGVNALRKLLMRHRKYPIKVFRDVVAADLEGERDKGFYDDDMTFVVFEYLGGVAPEKVRRKSSESTSSLLDLGDLMEPEDLSI